MEVRAHLPEIYGQASKFHGPENRARVFYNDEEIPNIIGLQQMNLLGLFSLCRQAPTDSQSGPRHCTRK